MKHVWHVRRFAGAILIALLFVDAGKAAADQSSNCTELHLDKLRNGILECQSAPNIHALKLEDFVNARLNVLRRTKGLHPQPASVKKGLLDLPGNYIIGSKGLRHYLTLEVDGRLSLKAMDPQDGATYVGSRIKPKMSSIDLALKII